MSRPRKGAGAVIAAETATRVPMPRDRFPGLGPRAYCMTVEGDGLGPCFCSGDVVVVDPDRIPEEGDAVVLYGDGRITEYAGAPGIFHVIVGRAL